MSGEQTKALILLFFVLLLQSALNAKVLTSDVSWGRSTNYKQALPQGSRGAKSVKRETPKIERAHTKYGTVVGQVKATVVIYLGIPYAKPPVGKLRWKPPHEPDRHVGEMHANRHGDSCLSLFGWETSIEDTLKLNPNYKSYNRNQSENCLYLNVYKPYSVWNPEEGFPVMVYVHGDSYQTNSGTVYDGSILARTQQVVVVTINYRLNVFGFFNFDKSFDGNFGIMDQIAALKYVQKNIKHFGGNPNSVTIFGASAGAASVQLLLASPSAKGLFHRAIAQSGSFRDPQIWLGTRQNHTRHLFSKMSSRLGCPSFGRNRIERSIECLRHVPSEFIMSALKYRESYEVWPVESFTHAGFEITVPAVAAPTIPADPTVLFSSGDFNAVPFLTGLVNLETGKFLASKTSSPGVRGFIRENANSIVDLNHADMEAITTKYNIKIRSPPYEDQTDDYPINFNRFFSDFEFNYPTKSTITQIAKHAPVYCYLFKHAPLNYVKRPGLLNIKGYAVHGDEVPFVFGAATDRKAAMGSKEERVLSYAMMSAFASFARQGVPSVQYAKKRIAWPVYKKPADRYIEFDLFMADKKNIKTGFLEKVEKIWEPIFKKYHIP